MTPPTDEKTGQPVLLDIDDEKEAWSNEAINAPKIFPIIWKVRDAKRAEVIRHSCENAQSEWQMLGLEPDER